MSLKYYGRKVYDKRNGQICCPQKCRVKFGKNIFSQTFLSERLFLHRIPFFSQSLITKIFDLELGLNFMYNDHNFICYHASNLSNSLFRILLYISAGDRFVHFFCHRLFYHSILDSCNEELMID